MAKKAKQARPKARLPKGLRDIGAAEIIGQRRMLTTIRRVFERYGFEPLETPAFEYTDALGKFLPDQDRPNEGVFSFQDEDEQWLSLRYDLTAPLARYVAENFDALPKPFRRYQTGVVWRNEKPGPGRFREFAQFDADTVGTSSLAADAELCMLAADTLEALGIERGQYVIKVNSRKVLDGALESIGLGGEENAGKRLTVLRALDKLDRLGVEGVRELLSKGRKDESGDYTKGADLDEKQIEKLEKLYAHREMRSQDFFLARSTRDAADDDDALLSSEGGVDLVIGNPRFLDTYSKVFADTEPVQMGIRELREISDLVRGAGYGTKRIRLDVSVVRGLEYYTGPVIEAELTFEVKDEKGKPIRFGSVGGGGRYDGLVERFTGQRIPATGFSIGVSRLYAALNALGATDGKGGLGPVVVTVFDKDRVADYQRMVQTLREANIRAELYLGSGKIGQQLKYADQRGSPAVIIQGGDEKSRGQVQVKDLIEGSKLSKEIEGNVEWRESRPAQVTVPEAKLVETVREILARYKH